MWERPKYVDPQQKEREEKALRGMRMNLRKVCNKLLTNRKFKDFYYPVNAPAQSSTLMMRL